MAQCNRRLLWEEIGLAENAVRSDLLTSLGRMALHILLDFENSMFSKTKDFVGPEHNGLPEALLQQNRELSANSEAIHF
jgi:hypothetical protein